MLNKSKLLNQINSHSDALFYDHSQEFILAKQIWQQIAQEDNFLEKVRNLNLPWSLPDYSNQIINAFEIKPIDNYVVISSDGSQIYPDRHQGTSCSLINIGTVQIQYSDTSKVELYNEPFLFTSHIDESNVEIVDCKRQELEFKFGLEAMQRLNKETINLPSLYLFDGSLIFWHLESKSSNIGQEYLGKYLGLLFQFFKSDLNIAGYISLPKSKDLVNLIRAQLVYEHKNFDAIENVLDTHIASFYLNKNKRSILFKSNSVITKEYPTQLNPYFFYLDIGQEIVRIEIPAYIAQDKQRVNQIASIILDQCNKGYGYPVVIAEAHEQAVVKGAERDFFYQMLYKLSTQHKQQILMSQKSIKKRFMGI